MNIWFHWKSIRHAMATVAMGSGNCFHRFLRFSQASSCPDIIPLGQILDFEWGIEDMNLQRKSPCGGVFFLEYF